MGISTIDATTALLNVLELRQDWSAELQLYSVFKELLSSDDGKESESSILDTFLSLGKSDGILKMTNFLLHKISHIFDECKDSLKRNFNVGRGKRSIYQIFDVFNDLGCVLNRWFYGPAGILI